MTKRSRITGLALAAAATLGFASSAQAAQFLTFNGSTGSFGNTGIGTQGAFTETFTFSVPRNGRLTSIITSTMTGPADNVNFNSTYVKLNPFPGVTFDIVSRGVTEIRQLLNVPVLAGTQTIMVQGFSGPLGSYTGSLAFSVPEPATWGLMILGFGATGFAMRRRRRALAAA